METKWISVKDRLPEIDQQVLAHSTLSEGWYFSFAKVESITKYKDSESAHWIDEDYNQISPTHWMPLPEPPKI